MRLQIREAWHRWLPEWRKPVAISSLMVCRRSRSAAMHAWAGRLRDGWALRLAAARPLEAEAELVQEFVRAAQWSLREQSYWQANPRRQSPGELSPRLGHFGLFDFDPWEFPRLLV